MWNNTSSWCNNFSSFYKLVIGKKRGDTSIWSPYHVILKYHVTKWNNSFSANNHWALSLDQALFSKVFTLWVFIHCGVSHAVIISLGQAFSTSASRWWGDILLSHHHSDISPWVRPCVISSLITCHHFLPMAIVLHIPAKLSPDYSH